MGLLFGGWGGAARVKKVPAPTREALEDATRVNRMGCSNS